MKAYRIAPLTLLLVTTLWASNLFAQSAAPQSAAVIEGEVKTRLVLSPSDIDKLPKSTINHKDREDREHIYSGVELGIVLKNAGVTLAEELKGENLTKYLLVEASDGYQVLFSLAEVDPAFYQRKIILANRKDGALLPTDEGPFRIIIEGEKRKPRNARQVISIKVKFIN